MPPPSRDFDREMQMLEAEIKRLEAEYNMFFAGRLPRPPIETRNRVAALVKRYDRMYIQNTADRFRFTMLQTRYAKFCELWERQIVAQEGGRLRARKAAAAAAAPPAPAAETPQSGLPLASSAAAPVDGGSEAGGGEAGADPAPAAPRKPVPGPGAPGPRGGGAEGVIHVAAVRDPVQEAARVKELYERLAEAKRAAGEAPPPYERVAELVRAQVDKFKAKGQAAAFRVAIKEGKVSLTVKPLSSDDSSE